MLLSDRTKFLLYILTIIIITSFHLYYLKLNIFNLYADEAQYWSWSRQLAFGYYSKPPMISWLIRLFTEIGGNSETWIRLPSPLLHCATSIIIFLIAKKLSNQLNIAIISSISYLLLPAVTLSASLISTDPLLLFFWAASCYLFLRATESDQTNWWIYAGTTLGFGILSKYNMIIFIPSCLLYLLYQDKELKSVLTNKNIWLGVIIAFLIYFPNLWWNYQHQFVSYSHTKDISKLDNELFHFDKLLEFIGAQIIIFGPIQFYLFFKSWFDNKYSLSQSDKFLLSFIWPFLIVILLLSFLSGSYANWAAPIYVTAIIYTVSYAIKTNQKKLLITSLCLNLALGIIFYNYHSLIKLLNGNLVKPISFDPYKRLYGWQQLGSEISQTVREYPDRSLLVRDRKLIAELIYYVEPKPHPVKKWNLSSSIKDHYDLTKKINNDDVNANFILVTNNPDITDIQPYFDKANLIRIIPISKIEGLNYYLYDLQQFKGL